MFNSKENSLINMQVKFTKLRKSSIIKKVNLTININVNQQ